RVAIGLVNAEQILRHHRSSSMYAAGTVRPSTSYTNALRPYRHSLRPFAEVSRRFHQPLVLAHAEPGVGLGRRSAKNAADQPPDDGRVDTLCQMISGQSGWLGWSSGSWLRGGGAYTSAPEGHARCSEERAGPALRRPGAGEGRPRGTGVLPGGARG